MKPRTLILTAFLVLALTAFFGKERWPIASRPSEPPPKPKAFLRAEWGMAPDQVAAANGVVLSKPTSRKRFYQPESGTESRYQTLEAPGRLLGRASTVSYTFLDGALVSYHVFTADSDDEALDAAMRGYLSKTFGPNFEEIRGEPALKMVWQFKDTVVNYWFYEEPNALSQPYRAGFGVQRLSSD